MEHRQHDQDAIAVGTGVDLQHLGHRRRIGRQVGMGEHRTLGSARGTGRVEDHGRIPVGIDDRCRRIGDRIEIFEPDVDHRRIDRTDPQAQGHSRRLGQCGSSLFSKGGLETERLGPGIVQHERDGRWWQQQIDRHDTGTGFEDPEITANEVRSVRTVESDPITGRDAALGQRGGDCVARGIEIRIGQEALIGEDGGSIGQAFGRMPEAFGKRA